MPKSKPKAVKKVKAPKEQKVVVPELKIPGQCLRCGASAHLPNENCDAGK